MGLVYLTGSSGVGKTTVWELFEAVVSLSVDMETLRRRLVGRPGAFGSGGDELERVLAWHARVDADNAGYGAVLVDATAPVAEIADAVERIAGELM